MNTIISGENNDSKPDISFLVSKGLEFHSH